MKTLQLFFDAFVDQFVIKSYTFTSIKDFPLNRPIDHVLRNNAQNISLPFRTFLILHLIAVLHPP